MDTMAAIKQTFFQECEEQLAELEAGLLAIEQEAGDVETINAVFRAVHSIKGGAGAFGLDDLVRFAHTFETTLDFLRGGRIGTSPQLAALMLRSADVLADLVRVSRDGGEIDETRVEQICEELGRAGGQDAAAAAPVPVELAPADDPLADEFGFAPLQVSFDTLIEEDAAAGDEQDFVIRFRPRPELYAKANDALRLLRELRRLGDAEIECDLSGLPPLAELDPEGAYLAWTVKLSTAAGEAAIREIFEFVEHDCELAIERAGTLMSDDDAAQALEALLAEMSGSREEAADKPEAAAIIPLPQAANAAPAAASQPQATIRVDLDRVDRLIDLVGELVINQSMLAQRVTEAGIARLSDVAVGLDDLEHLTREIQDSVMAIRAQPVRPIFQRMSRVVREVADMTGKSVRLITEGENCEVDKTVIERLADPLTHMIRNAIDHGLEKTEDRIRAGKPEQGVVRMAAAHRSGRVVIEVSDDGAGIDRAKVREIAVGKGIIEPDAVLGDAETDDLIFAPGFSTAAAISDVSGRGVGMDVVRRAIQALGGRITIASRPGQGTSFTLSLPLTLAVLDGMVVTVAGQTLVVPLTAIVETLQPKAGDIHDLGGEARVVAIRGAFVPLIDVGCVLGYRAGGADPMQSVAVMVETESHAQSALLVDTIIGQQQVVIKSLETNYGHVDGVAAATILGDGRVAVILDIDSVVAGTKSDPVRNDQTSRRRNAA